MKNYEVNFSGYAGVSEALVTPCNYSGVYCVFVGFPPDPVNLLYIGLSLNNIGDRINGHEKKECWRTMAKRITGKDNKPLYYTTYKNQEEIECEEVEAALIFNFQPPCNDEYRKEFPSRFRSVKVKVSGDVSIFDVPVYGTSTFMVKSGETKEISGIICNCNAG